MRKPGIWFQLFVFALGLGEGFHSPHLHVNIRMRLDHLLEERNLLDRILQIGVESADRGLHDGDAGAAGHVDQGRQQGEFVVERRTEIAIEHERSGIGRSLRRLSVRKRPVGRAHRKPIPGMSLWWSRIVGGSSKEHPCVCNEFAQCTCEGLLQPMPSRGRPSPQRLSASASARGHALTLCEWCVIPVRSDVEMAQEWVFEASIERFGLAWSLQVPKRRVTPSLDTVCRRALSS
jgi:hypothetical protein